MSIYEQALAFAARGWRVLPLHSIDPSDGCCSCGNPQCESPGKHPLTPNGVKDATTDAQTIERWWRETNGLANLGIATGDGRVVVDADAKSGGLKTIDQWEQEHGALPLTLTASTGGGGKHYYLALPKGVSIGNKVAIAQGVDIRSDGGYVVAPPSLHKSGERYEWLTPVNTPLAELPAWLLPILQSNGKAEGNHTASLVVEGFDLSTHHGVSEGNRNATLCHLAGVHLARGESIEVIEPLALAWASRCTPLYPQEPTLKTLHALAQKHEREREQPIIVCETEDVLDAIPLPSSPQWPMLHPDAYHGIAGDIVGMLEPETEADPVAILMSLLVCFGNCVGRKVWFPVEGDKHYPNLFCCLVGQSSRGRKGTSLGRTLTLWDASDPWQRDGIKSGLSSGEGLKYHVRDAVETLEPVKEKGKVVSYQTVVKDDGVSDKRLLVVEPEFAQALKQMQREGNTLSPVLRQAWDTGNLKTLTKNDPTTATDAHISVLGHITSDELGKMLSDCDTANGFANRFLWALVKRSKLLPDGGREIDLSPLRVRVQQAIAGARGSMSRSPQAQRLWRELYPVLTAERSGRYGMATSRAEAQTLRLSMIYAYLDGSNVIQPEHLRAAYAVWCYCEASAKFIFGEGEELPPLERKLLQKIVEKPGSNRRELHKALGGHVPADAMVTALGTLQAQRLVVAEVVATGGRPCERWWPADRKTEPTDRTDDADCETTNKAPLGICSATADAFGGNGDHLCSFARTSSAEAKAEAHQSAEFPAPTPALCGETEDLCSFVRNPTAERDALTLQLVSRVKAMGGTFVRQGDGLGIQGVDGDLLLTDVLKASVDAPASEIAPNKPDEDEEFNQWLNSLNAEDKAFVEGFFRTEQQEDGEANNGEANASDDLWHTANNHPCPYERMVAMRRLLGQPIPTESKEEWLNNHAADIERVKAKHRICRG